MKKSRKFLSLFLTLAMTCSMSSGLGVAAYADDSTGAADNGTTAATITTPLDFTGSVPEILTETAAGSGIYENADAGITWYAAATTANGVTYAANTLVLDGAHIDCSGNAPTEGDAFAIKLPDGAKVITAGDSTVVAGDAHGTVIIDSEEYYTSSAGIYGVGSLTFEGSGRLSATGANSYGICAETALTNSGSIVGRAVDADYFTSGIMAFTELENTAGARMEGISGRSGNEFDTIGICCDGIWIDDDTTLGSGGILTNAGTMIGTADESDGYSDGIYAAASIINTGTITGTAGDAKGPCYGIFSRAIDNSGSLTGTGAHSERNSYGVYSNSISNSGSLTCAGAHSERNSYGVYSNSISNSGSITTSSGKANTSSHGICATTLINETGAEINAAAGEGTDCCNGLNILDGGITIQEGSVVNASGNTGSTECYGIWSCGNVTVNGTLNLHGSKLNDTGDTLAMLIEPYEDEDGNDSGTLTLTIGEKGMITSDGLVSTMSIAFGDGDHIYTVINGDPAQLDGTVTSVAPVNGKTMIISVNGYTGETETASEFTDVASDAWYADAVAWAVANGITTGTDETHFSPDAVTTRAQLVTFLWRASGSPAVTVNTAFKDLKSGSWYEQAVKWASAMGYVNGIDATHFGPDENVTRAQTVTILARMAGASDTAAGSAQNFSDVSADSYYANAVAWAVKNGITSGMGEGMFAPDESCTRAQIVTFLYRALAK